MKLNLAVVSHTVPQLCFARRSLSPFLSYYIASVIPSTICSLGLQAAVGRGQDAHAASKDVYDWGKISTLSVVIISNLAHLPAAKGVSETLGTCHGLVDLSREMHAIRVEYQSSE
jgi:hypothetical protein